MGEQHKQHKLQITAEITGCVRRRALHVRDIVLESKTVFLVN